MPRRVSILVGTALALLVLIAAASTLRWRSVCFRARKCVIGVVPGAAFVQWDRNSKYDVGIGFSRDAFLNRFERRELADGWREYGAWPRMSGGAAGGELRLPLWMLFIATGGPAGWLWLASRRTDRPGKCRRCGYDLTGNASGRCPECGIDLSAVLGQPRARMSSLARLSAVIGIMHLLTMLWFWSGAELALLVVYIADLPIVLPLSRLVPDDELAMLISLVTCSVIYPALFYGVVRFIQQSKPGPKTSQQG